jgi:glycosyltransferase involved in cell wall biosynthesis
MSRIKALLDRVAVALADEVTFISRSAAADVLGDGAAQNAEIIYNALPDRNAPPAPSGIDTVELLYVGTASARKRTALLPGILAGVRRRLPEARLRVIGFELEDAPQLYGRLLELGLLDAVVSEGPLTSEQVDGFYGSASVLLVPSAYEGLPMVIMEALRAGLPCVATDVGGAAELLEDGVNGVLVPVDDTSEMVAGCLRVLTDPEAAMQMSKSGQALIRGQFSVARQVAAYRKLYGQMSDRSAK